MEIEKRRAKKEVRRVGGGKYGHAPGWTVYVGYGTVYALPPGYDPSQPAITGGLPPHPGGVPERTYRTGPTPKPTRRQPTPKPAQRQPTPKPRQKVLQQHQHLKFPYQHPVTRKHHVTKPRRTTARRRVTRRRRTPRRRSTTRPLTVGEWLFGVW